MFLRKSIINKNPAPEMKPQTSSQLSPRMKELKLNDRLVQTFLRLSNTQDYHKASTMDSRLGSVRSRKDSMLTSNDIDDLINNELEFNDQEAIKLLFYIDFANIKNMRSSFSVIKAQSESHEFGFLLLDFLVKYFESGIGSSASGDNAEDEVFSSIKTIIPKVNLKAIIKEKYGTFVALFKQIH